MLYQGDCSIRVSRYTQLGFTSYVTPYLLLRFFSTTAKSFYDYYSSYKLIFSSHDLNGCGVTVRFFNSQIQPRHFDIVGCFVSYLCSLFPDSFQTTKRHSYDGYSTYMLSFNSFLQVVYPVDVTTNQSCFIQIISHNSEILYGFALKLVQRFILMCLFCVPRFGLILACILVLQ